MKKIILIVVIQLFLGLSSMSAQQTGIEKHAFSPSGKLLATGNYAGEINVWDLTTRKNIFSTSLKTKELGLLDFTTDNKTLIVSDSDKKRINFFEIATGKEVKRLDYRNVGSYFGGDESVVSADGQTLWLIKGEWGNDPGEAWALDLKNNRLKAVKPLLGYSWCFDQSREMLAGYSADDKKIILVSANTGQEIRRIPVDSRFVSEYHKVEMLLSTAGSKLYLHRKYDEKKKDNEYGKNYFHEIAVVSTADGAELKKQSFPLFQVNETVFDKYSTLDISADSAKLFLSETPDDDDADVYTEHLTTIDAGTLQKNGESYYPAANQTWSALSPDGKTVFTADETEKIKVWETGTIKQIAELFAPEAPYEQIAVSSDDSKFAAIAYNGTIKIWSAEGKELLKIQSGLPEGKMIAFSPNGQNLLTVHLNGEDETDTGENKKIRAYFKIWNVATGKLIREFDNDFYQNIQPQDFIFYTRQGDRIIAGCGNDKKSVKLCVWNAVTGEFSGRTFPINDEETISILKINDNQTLSFNTTGGKKLVPKAESGSEYLVWDLANEKLIKQTADAAEAAGAVGENQNATVILINSLVNAEKHHWVLQLDGKTALKTAPDNLATDYISPDQTLGGRFIAGAVEPTNATLETSGTIQPSVIPGNNDDYNTPKVFPGEADELKNEVEIFNPDDSSNMLTLKGHTDDLIDLAFTRGTKRAITSGYDRTVRLWDLTTGKQLAVLR